MKKSYIVAVLLAVIIFISVLVVDSGGDMNPELENTIVHEAPSGPGEVSDYTDPPALTEHQVALNDLYVKIPNQKSDVDLTKRTTDKYIIVDITDKETGELLYTYGESAGHGNEKLVFREVPTKEGKVRLQMVVDIDSVDSLISKVVETKVVYDPKPKKVENEAITAISRSGELPAENIEVSARLYLNWGNETQDLYEGYEIGII
ncbi:hypothetical protein DVB69_00250 [Sporosarcina sp. BI001-red]|uniref:hypothetical protein n=1 Tax=Sporosarcina sp. BI001-red TaxID=2282866 RepID=UPI000E21DF63|nr:hypothetical protein [Sporosarcina sp. BI001-red]REB11611.1 hypothetical protein DVB69_00250 [Sporosarcina sp. BI001-red]